MNRRVVALAALATAALTACGVSAPPPNELANEMVDTLKNVSPQAKACMHDKLESYSDNDLEAITNGLASDNTETQADSQAALDRFESDLAACN